MSCCNTNTINDQTLYDRMSVGGVFEIGEYNISDSTFYYDAYIDFKRGGGGMYDNEIGERFACLHNVLMNGTYEFIMSYYKVCDGMPKSGEKWKKLKVSKYGLSAEALRKGVVASIRCYNAEGREIYSKLLVRR